MPELHDLHNIYRKCSTCKIVKPLSSFYNNRCFKYGKEYHCIDCKKWARFEDKWDLSKSDYMHMLKEQSGVCAICGLPETGTNKGNIINMAVDHDHKTGKIRGLLCSKCNRGLGMFYDDTDRLQSAINYIERNYV